MHNFLKYFASGEMPEHPMNLIKEPIDDREMCDFIGTLCFCDNFEISKKYQKWPDI